MHEILLIADDGGRQLVREALIAFSRMRITTARLTNELAVRQAELHPSAYNVILIAHAHLPPCDPSTHVDRLPNPQWHLQQLSTGGIRTLEWIVADCAKLRVPVPHIFMGCHVPIRNADRDYRENIRSRSGIPFYLDSGVTNDRTHDGTLTMHGLIKQVTEFA